MVSLNVLAHSPASVLEGLGLNFREYPIAFPMTRRAWALNSHEVMNQRNSALGPKWNDPRSFPDSLTCREGGFRIE